MGGRKLTLAERDLRASRKARAKIAKLGDALAPSWKTKMLAHYDRRIAYDEGVVAQEEADRIAVREARRKAS